MWFDSWDTENVGPHHASSWELGKRCKWQLVLFCRTLWVKSFCLHRSCQVVLRDELRLDVEAISRAAARLWGGSAGRTSFDTRWEEAWARPLGGSRLKEFLSASFLSRESTSIVST